MLRPSPRLKDSESLGGIRGWNLAVFLLRCLLTSLRLDIAGKHCFRSEFGLESYLVQCSLVVSKSASVGGACTSEWRRVAPRREHHCGNLYRCLAFMVLPPTSLLIVWTIITEHMTFTNAEKIPHLEKVFWGDTSVHFFPQFSLNYSENQVVTLT